MIHFHIFYFLLSLEREAVAAPTEAEGEKHCSAVPEEKPIESKETQLFFDELHFVVVDRLVANQLKNLNSKKIDIILILHEITEREAVAEAVPEEKHCSATPEDNPKPIASK